MCGGLSILTERGLQMKIPALAAAMILSWGMGPAGSVWGADVAPVVHAGAAVDNEGDATSCVACHDGAATGVLSYRLAGGQGNVLGSHPVEISYPGFFDQSRFHSEAEILQAGLRLREGKVTCISCHDLRLNGRPYYVPVSLDRSGLCLSCHRI